MLHSLYVNVTILLSLITFPEDSVRSENPKLAQGQKWKVSTAIQKPFMCLELYMGESNNFNRKKKKKKKENSFHTQQEKMLKLASVKELKFPSLAEWNYR